MVRDVLGTWRSGVFGPPGGIRTDGGGEWKNAIWTDLREGRRVELQFQGRAPILGSLEGAVAFFAEFITDPLKVIGSQAGRFSQKRNGG